MTTTIARPSLAQQRDALVWATAAATRRVEEVDHRDCSGNISTDSDFSEPCSCRNPATARDLEEQRQERQAIFDSLEAMRIVMEEMVEQESFYSSSDWPSRLLAENRRITVFDIQRSIEQFGADAPETTELGRRWGAQRP